MEAEKDLFGLVGHRLAGKYDVSNVVAAGGFGLVYRGLHTTLNKSVAIKVLMVPRDLNANARAEFMRMFLQEAQTIAQLRHPAVVQVLDSGVDDMPAGTSAPWMALEWIDGQTLDDLLESRRGQGGQSPNDVLATLRPVIEALAYAHDLGIAHRDIKPANMMLPRQTAQQQRHGIPGIQLLDFGIAKLMDPSEQGGVGVTLTGSANRAYSPMYAAPEQVSGARTGPWTDVHALGLILTEMLTDRQAYASEDQTGLFIKMMSPQRPTPAQVGVHVGGWEPVIARCLALLPRDRFQSAGELLGALENSLPARGSLPSMPALPNTQVYLHDATGERPLGPPTGTEATSPVTSAMEGMAVPGAPWPQGASVPAATLNPMVGNTRITARRRSTGALMVVGVIGLGVVAGLGAWFFVVGRTAPRQWPTHNTAPPATVITLPAGPTVAPGVTAPPAPSIACPVGMVAEPAGSFWMGSPDGVGDPDEHPQHVVTLSAYCIDRTEVTIGRYRTCVHAGKCGDPDHSSNAVRIDLDDHPVNGVTWDEAKRYCQQASARLPTEAEWEYAARGREGRLYPWGNTAPTPQLLNEAGRDDGWALTAPVGTYPAGATPTGLMDMAGNLWEWVADWHGTYAPGAGTNPSGPETGTTHSIRGGSWEDSDGSRFRTANRDAIPPTMRAGVVGFRCARTAGAGGV